MKAGKCGGERGAGKAVKKTHYSLYFQIFYMLFNVPFRKGMELKMATIGAIRGLKFLLNRVAYNKRINSRLFT